MIVNLSNELQALLENENYLKVGDTYSFNNIQIEVKYIEQFNKDEIKGDPGGTTVLLDILDISQNQSELIPDLVIDLLETQNPVTVSELIEHLLIEEIIEIRVKPIPSKHKHK